MVRSDPAWATSRWMWSFKDIKNVHLSVHPPTGRVRISAPYADEPRHDPRLRHLQAGVDQAAAEKAAGAGARNAPRVPGAREPLRLGQALPARQSARAINRRRSNCSHSRMSLRVRPATDEDRRQAIVEEWYREQLKQAVPPLLAKWQPLHGVKVERFFVQRMKTKWGSCNPVARTIRLNTDLAKKPRECLEYIVVHEMVHLLEADAQRPVRGADGPIHARLAIQSGGAQPPAGSGGQLELLK